MIAKTLARAGSAARLLPALAVGLLALASEGHAARPEQGVWLNDTGEGAIEIYICEDNANRLCGRIVWLKEPLNAEGKPKRDRYNPAPENQFRPICGLPTIGNLGLMSDGTFDGGWIYDPKTGKQYSAALKMSGQNLVVTGYLGIKMLGKSFTWTPAPPEIARCEGAPPPPA
jgi:uncharacterized protein (DUF2147 family)